MNIFVNYELCYTNAMNYEIQNAMNYEKNIWLWIYHEYGLMTENLSLYEIHF